MPDGSEPKKTALDRLIGSLKGGTIGAGLGAGAGVGLGIFARKGEFGRVAARYAKKRLSFLPSLDPKVVHAITGASIGSKIGGVTGLLIGRKSKEAKELSSLLSDLIQFERGDVIARKMMQRIGMIGPEAAKEEFEKQGLKALPMVSAIKKHLIPPRGHPEASRVYRAVTRLRRRGIKPFAFSVARNLFNKVKEIQFKTLYQPGGKDEPPETLPKLQGVVDYTVQRHAAKRAGLHRDIRIGSRRHGLLSWATRKDLPTEGGKIAIHPQAVHPHSYLGWEGDIPSGYGAGQVSTEHLGKALITKSTPTEVHATLADQREHHRVAFLKTPQGWLLTRGKYPEPPKEAQKPKYKNAGPEALESLPKGTIVQPKVDGALVYVTTKGSRPEVFSHRTSNVSGKNVVHTERFFKGRPEIKVPKEHQRTLIGELYGVRKGKAIEPQELGGILNTHIGESINKQKKKGVRLKIMPFDYADGKGESYPERLAKVKQTLQHLPKGQFHPPEEARTSGEARRLYEKIKQRKHPLTKEGVIVHPPTGTMLKIKNTEESNVKIGGTFPGEGKFQGSHGGFVYTDKKGNVLGRVGTGFNDETRRSLHKYVGRTARIRHQGKYPSGAYRAPSFIAVDESR